jgi:hypothetical protein
MLPQNDDLIRAMAHRTRSDAERSARDRGFRDDAREAAASAARRSEPSRRGPGPDCRPCPPTASERAQGLAR